MASQLSEIVHVKRPRRTEVRRGLCACRKPLSNSQDASTNLTRPAWFQLSGDGPIKARSLFSRKSHSRSAHIPGVLRQLRLPLGSGPKQASFRGIVPRERETTPSRATTYAIRRAPV